LRRLIAASIVVVASLIAADPAVAQSSTDDHAAVLAKLDALEAAEARVLRQLEALSRQVVELRTTLPTNTPRVPPAPVVPAEPVSLDDVPVKGAPGASVVIIEYADFQCPFCGDFARQTLPALMEKYVAPGKVRIAFRHLPLPEIHPQALIAAEAAECARRQGKFWELHDALFRDQQLDQAALIEKAKTAGVDVQEFGECVRGPGASKVRQELAAARAAGLNVTPTFFLGYSQPNGSVRIDRIITGVRDAASFSAALDQMLDGSSPR
jgi:protein-disulfide isomerase